MNERVEFIDQKEEHKDNKKGLLRELLDGSVLTKAVVVRQLPYFVFATLLAVLYISNRYHAEKVVRNTVSIQNEIRELRAESISIAADLMHISKQSEVAKIIERRGLELKASMAPPKKLIIEDKD